MVYPINFIGNIYNTKRIVKGAGFKTKILPSVPVVDRTAGRPGLSGRAKNV
jgi:hypothetical protein